MATDVSLTAAGWVILSSSACSYQLQSGDKAYVLVSATAPDVSETGIIIRTGEIYSFNSPSGGTLWAKAYYGPTPHGVIKVTDQFFASNAAGGSDLSNINGGSF
jgi:hypothetical protein